MFENTQTGITFWTSKKMLYFQNWVTLADIWKQVQDETISLVMLPTWYVRNTFCRKVWNVKEKKYSYIMQIVQYTDKYGNNKTIDFNILNNEYNIFPEIVSNI